MATKAKKTVKKRKVTKKAQNSNFGLKVGLVILGLVIVGFLAWPLIKPIIPPGPDVPPVVEITPVEHKTLYKESLRVFADYLGRDNFEFIKTTDDLFLTMRNMTKVSYFKDTLDLNVKEDLINLSVEMEQLLLKGSSEPRELTKDDIEAVVKLILQHVKDIK